MTKKKILIFGLTITAALSLSACGSDSTSTETTTTTTTNTEVITTEVNTEPITTEAVVADFPTDNDTNTAKEIETAIKATLANEDLYNVYNQSPSEWTLVMYSEKGQTFMAKADKYADFTSEVNKNFGNKEVTISDGSVTTIEPTGWGIFFINTDGSSKYKICAIKQTDTNKYSIMEMINSTGKVNSSIESYEYVEPVEEVTEEIVTEEVTTEAVTEEVTTEAKKEKKKESKKETKKTEKATEKSNNDSCVGDDALINDGSNVDTGDNGSSDESCIGDDALVW